MAVRLAPGPEPSRHPPPGAPSALLSSPAAGPRRRRARARRRALASALLASLLLLLGAPAAPAQPIRYEHDALGRLSLVSTPEGVATYEYDAVGNILRITTHRYDEAAGPVAILALRPDRGAPGTVVTLYGKGFAPMPADNQVAFNGVAAPVIAVSASTLTTLVPPGATTGPITLTTTQGTAASPGPFTVLQAFAVLPEQMDVALEGTVDFQATLDGTATAEVTWRVNGIAGGTAALGTISPSGLYTAPSSPPPLQPVPIEAVLTAEPGQGARARVRIVGQVSGLEAAAPVSVRVAAPAAPAASAPVSVALRPRSDPVAGPPVAVRAGPVLTGISPSGAPPGSSNLTLTLTGANLQGASAVQALRSGSPDPTLTLTSVLATPEGTRLSCTLTISPSAPLGPRLLQVLTPQGPSGRFALDSNTFTVTAP